MSARKMNNLLQILTGRNVKPLMDLLLLNTIKKGQKRSADNKLSDIFYDALEGILIDLKPITLVCGSMILRDVRYQNAEVPDYYDVIATPTMLKKVKLKQYKSKREFEVNLELIWSHCYMYNISEQPWLERLLDKVFDRPSLDDHNSQPRKRARFLTPYPVPLSPGHDQARDELSELWWAAAQSGTLLANDIPPIPFGLSSSNTPSPLFPPPSLISSYPSSSSSFTHHLFHYPPSTPKSKPQPKRRKKQNDVVKEGEVQPTHIENPKALLNLTNTDIKTMRMIRHTHGKFVVLNSSTLANEEAEEDGGASGAPGSNATRTVPGLLSGDSDASGAADDEILNEKVDEKPWVMIRKVASNGKGKGMEREKVAKVGVVDIGEKNAWGCLQWTNQKTLEHVGSQGTSRVALDVMSGVLSEYISNVGRTIKFMCDKYSGTMTPEEIILHMLFESGTRLF
ncbi:Transcriptional activator spt7 [Leucoagaricus sp. SymC.cos]|nr:Transcriptional activator spt7 [Leucoagaricus sp. SymC.cos]